MNISSLVLAAIFGIAGICLAIISVKARKGTLPRNQLAGIRTELLMQSENNWVKGHKAAALYLFSASAVCFIGAAICAVVSVEIGAWVSVIVSTVMLVAVVLGKSKAHAAVKNSQ